MKSDTQPKGMAWCLTVIFGLMTIGFGLAGCKDDKKDKDDDGNDYHQDGHPEDWIQVQVAEPVHTALLTPIC